MFYFKPRFKGFEVTGNLAYFYIKISKILKFCKF